MDKQTKLIAILSCVVIILGVIFALKVTGVIAKKESINITQQEYTNTTDVKGNKSDKDDGLSVGSMFGGVIQSIFGFAIIGVILVGFYKAYDKLGIPKSLLKIGFIGLPILYVILCFLMILMIQNALSIINIIMIVGVIELIVLVCINYYYFKCLDMNGSIAFLTLIPIIATFIRIPFAGAIDLVVAVIMLVYGVISIGKLTEYFNKSQLYAVGIFFLPFIFIPIIGYSKD